MTTEELLEAVRAYVDERYFQNAEALTVHLRGGNKIRLPMPDRPARPSANAQPTGHAVTRLEKRILQAVAKLEADEPTIKDIAAAAKLPNDPHLRKFLAAMRTRGLLGGDKADESYPITPLGLTAVESTETKIQ